MKREYCGVCYPKLWAFVYGMLHYIRRMRYPVPPQLFEAIMLERLKALAFSGE
jgi:hypothetical protein